MSTLHTCVRRGAHTLAHIHTHSGSQRERQRERDRERERDRGRQTDRGSKCVRQKKTHSMFWSFHLE